MLAFYLEPAGPLARLPACPQVTEGSCPSDATWDKFLATGFGERLREARGPGLSLGV